jgi:hypothetical protein
VSSTKRASSPTSSTAPTPSATPALSAAATPSAVSTRITTTDEADPQQASGTRYALPVLLMFGGLMALGGSSALLLSAGTSFLSLFRRRKP